MNPALLCGKQQFDKKFRKLNNDIFENRSIHCSYHPGIAWERNGEMVGARTVNVYSWQQRKDAGCDDFVIPQIYGTSIGTKLFLYHLGLDYSAYQVARNGVSIQRVREGDEVVVSAC